MLGFSHNKKTQTLELRDLYKPERPAQVVPERAFAPNCDGINIMAEILPSFFYHSCSSNLAGGLTWLVNYQFLAGDRSCK